MFKDLFEYDDLQEASPENFGFSGVTFLRDFGFFKKGDEVYSLWFDLENAEVTAYNSENDEIAKFKFKLVSI